MASNAAEAQYTSLQVASWLKETLKLPSTKSVDVKQLSTSFLPACKGSNMIAFWSSMMTHVRPVEEVDGVKQNIELTNGRKRREELVAELERKRRKLKVLRDESDSLALQVRNKNDEVQLLNQQVKESQELKKKMQLKSQLFRGYADMLDEQISSCKGYLNWIAELKDTYKGKRNFDVAFGKAVESACCVLNETIDDGLVDRKKLFPMVGDLVKNFSPEVIMSSLTKMTNDAMKLVQRDVDVFNVENELADLQDKIQKGSLSYGPASGTTLRGMLEKWNKECVKSYFELLQNERNYREKLRTATNIRENVIELLRQQYEFEPTSLQVAIDHLDAEAEIMAATTCLSCLQFARGELKERITKGRKTQQDAQALGEKILTSSNVIRRDQERLIQTLRRNGDLASSLLGHQEEVQNYGQQVVCSQQDDVTKCCTNTRTVARQHLSAFNHADIEKLCQVETQDGLCPLKDLSIHRYNDISQEKGTFSYQRTLCRLSAHGHAPPSTALHKIHEIRSQIDRLKAFQASVDEIGAVASIKQLTTVQRTCRETDMKMSRKLEPRYKTGLQVADQAKKHCANFDETIKVWYEQPAQHQAPWLTLNGLTLQEWKARKHQT